MLEVIALLVFIGALIVLGGTVVFVAEVIDRLYAWIVRKMRQ